MLSANQLQIAQTLELFINETEFLYDTTHIDLLLWLSLDELETALSAIITASGRFSDGSIPAWLLPPTEAQATLQAVNAYALKNEQTAAVSSPMDLHHVPTTVVSSSDAWVIVLHVPVVRAIGWLLLSSSEESIYLCWSWRSYVDLYGRPPGNCP